LRGAIVALCLGLLVVASSTAADTASDLLTPEERAWLAAHPDVVLDAGEDWVGTLMMSADARGNLSGFLVDHRDPLNRKLGINIRNGRLDQSNRVPAARPAETPGPLAGAPARHSYPAPGDATGCREGGGHANGRER
jgi:hypothetical protein